MSPESMQLRDGHRIIGWSPDGFGQQDCQHAREVISHLPRAGLEGFAVRGRFDEPAFPQWFDEGLAVVVSGDPRYLPNNEHRCLVQSGRSFRHRELP